MSWLCEIWSHFYCSLTCWTVTYCLIIILNHFKINLTSCKQQIFKSINYIKNTDAYKSVCCRFPKSAQELDFWHVYVLALAFSCDLRTPHVPLTSHWGHWPLLIHVSGITWRGSKLLETLSFIRVTQAHVWWRVVEGVGEQRYKQKQSAVAHVIIVSCLTCIVLQVWLTPTSMLLKSERMQNAK
jgi:hypothetical protein